MQMKKIDGIMSKEVVPMCTEIKPRAFLMQKELGFWIYVPSELTDLCI